MPGPETCGETDRGDVRCMPSVLVALLVLRDCWKSVHLHFLIVTSTGKEAAAGTFHFQAAAGINVIQSRVPVCCPHADDWPPTCARPRRGPCFVVWHIHSLARLGGIAQHLCIQRVCDQESAHGIELKMHKAACVALQLVLE